MEILSLVGRYGTALTVMPRVLMQAAQESDNLLPAWQQGDKSAWELFTYKQQNVTWIDGSEVLAAECKKKSTPPSPDHSRKNDRVACGQLMSRRHCFLVSSVLSV